MNELQWSHPELWPWLFLLVPVWLLLHWSLGARARRARRYGAASSDRVPPAAACPIAPGYALRDSLTTKVTGAEAVDERS